MGIRKVPVSEDEKRVLNLIIEGYSNVNIKHNNNKSLFSYAKIRNRTSLKLTFTKSSSNQLSKQLFPIPKK